MTQPSSYRDNFAPALIDRDMPSNGRAQAAEQLAATFSNFARKGAGIVGEIRADQGAAQGLADSLKGDVKPRAGMSAHTAFGGAYNNALEAGYASKQQTAIAENLDRIEQENPTDSLRYEESVKGFAKGLLESAPPEYRPKLELMIGARAAAGRTRIHGAEQELHLSESVADYLAGADARQKLALQTDTDDAIVVAVTENESQIAALVKDGAITPVQGEQFRQKFASGLDDALAADKMIRITDGLMAAARGDVEKGDQLLAAVESREDLSSAEKNAIRDQYRKERGLLEWERSRTHMQESAALSQRLAAGVYGESIEGEARRLYRLGAISAEEFSSTLSTSTRNERAQIEDTSAVEAVRSALASGHGIDPRDGKQAAAVDKLFQGAVAQAGEAPGSKRWQAGAIELARISNVLPESASSWARVNLLSGDPNAASTAASFMKRVQDANPAAAPYGSDPKIEALADALNGNLAAGLPSARAYELAMNSTYLLTDQQRKALDERYKVDKVAKGNADALRSMIDSDDKFDPSAFSFAPGTTVAMQAEFDSLVRQYYGQGSDAKAARKLAFEAIRGTWGVTSMNGDRELVKFPPESLGLSPEAVRADVAETLRGAGVALDPDTVRLVPNPSTDRTKGKVWSLVHVDEFGAQDIVRDAQNRPVVYALPLGQDYARVQASLAAQKLAEARAERAARLKNAADQTELDRQRLAYELEHGFLK